MKKTLTTKFYATHGQVVEAVRTVLSRHPYRNTDEANDGHGFVTIFEPSLWWVPTPMSVKIGQENQGQVAVQAETRSSWLFYADPLDNYGRLIRKFFRSVAKHLDSR